ncbi:hypothetical protein Pint_27898 [Pistacia integerrima]|uniref:Uncharacterized protein n=1 Tax=Pistacia integerrima TaxID=434235 RepID=A0ACC0YUL8_9ROSI|nr:hypothetical protein Pint_27898 [Pistacia integerrima]
MVSEPSIANAFVDPMASATKSSSSFAAFHLPSQVISIKLDGTNFLAWSAQLLPLFRSYGLMGIVDGSETSPPQFSSAENKTQVISTIYGLETSRLAWQALGARSHFFGVSKGSGGSPSHFRQPLPHLPSSSPAVAQCVSRSRRHPPTDLAAMVAEANTTYLNQNQWYADSGANIHVTSDIANLATSQPYDGDDSVGVGHPDGGHNSDGAKRVYISLNVIFDESLFPTRDQYLFPESTRCMDSLPARDQPPNSARCVDPPGNSHTLIFSPPSHIFPCPPISSPSPLLASSLLDSDTHVLSSSQPETHLDSSSSPPSSPSLALVTHDSAPSAPQDLAPSLSIPHSHMITRSQTGHSKPRNFPDFHLYYSTRHHL